MGRTAPRPAPWMTPDVRSGVMAVYSPNIVSFDIVPPLRYVGADNKRRAWQEAFAAYHWPHRLRGTRLERHDARRAGLRS